MGDMGSGFDPSEQPQNASLNVNAPPQPTFLNLPYTTTRLSRSQFTYKFQVTAGQKFIRLYFNSASYQGFDSSKAFFSVKAGHYTLLSNFNASLTAEYLGIQPFVKEFCLNVEENQILNITFAPSPTASNDTYAFINGIEIVSMPTNLYYTPSTQWGPSLVGHPNYPVEIDNKTELETAYRLNVGGRSIPPVQDSGLYRSWFDDSGYLLKPTGVVSSKWNESITIKYTKIPAYTAPEDVYQTVRSMGPTQNMGYNLTWVLPVDWGFVYLVRLHFCEFVPEISKPNDMNFIIFIQNQTVERYADAIYWSGGNGVAVYRDYAVMMAGEGVKGKRDLFIALHPKGYDEFARYSDAILNGLEVFKLSSSDRSLADPDPDPYPFLNLASVEPPSSTAEMSKNRRTLFLPVGGSVVGGLVLVSLLCYAVFLLRRRSVRNYGQYSWWEAYWAKSSKTKAPLLPSDLCRHVSLAEIRTATNNFNDDFLIGVGGFGNVYRGCIDGGATPVAIKRLNPESQQGAHEFKTEIEMLSRLRYVHLVSLIGYCDDGREMILVYDYMAHGNLRDHLYKTNNPPLSWKKRLEICIGAARGLNYLHTSANHSIIHRDVKTTNILLDDRWVAKASDFGLSKVGPTNMSHTHVSTVVKGSFGYLDPEYYRRQQLTTKSDVYSFGVVLFEVLCARPPLDHTLENEQVSLALWAQQCYRKGTLDQIIDPCLKGQITQESLMKFGEIAVSCLHDEGIKVGASSDSVASGAVFSEIMDPKGR